MNETAQTLVACIRRHAEETPKRDAVIVPGWDGACDTRIDISELDRRCRAGAARLLTMGLAGKPIVICTEATLEYVTAVLCCMYAGAIAVPLPAPVDERGRRRLSAVVQATGAHWSIGSGSASLQPLELPGPPDDDILSPWPEVDPESIALIQYSSGTTRAPRGIPLRHRHIFANQLMIRDAFRLGPEDVFVSWLPLYHDMGLVGALMQSLFLGIPLILLTPAEFLQRPARWLQTIGRFGATISGGPDFGYVYATRRVTDEELDGLDLGSWRVAFNGAEPIRAGTLARFARRFGRAGFRYESFHPCYGLAEASLIVSGCQVAGKPVTVQLDADALRSLEVRLAEDGMARVASGGVVRDTRVRIVGPDGATVIPEGGIGEIWVAGAAVADGYWPCATSRVAPSGDEDAEVGGAFGAWLAEDGTYLRTGDLGMFHHGQLVVLGRLRDLVILRGQNHLPQDLEDTAMAADPGVLPGGVVAFTVERAGEARLVVVFELRQGADAAVVAQAVRKSVSVAHGVRVDEVLVVPPGTIPKTTSGKCQRGATRDAWLSGHLPLITCETPTTASSPGPDGLAALCIEVSRRRGATVEPGQVPGELGLDSVEILEVSAALEATLGVSFELHEWYLASSLSALAQGLSAAPTLSFPPAGHESQLLTLSQRALLISDELDQGGGPLLARAWELAAGGDPERIARAVAFLGSTLEVIDAGDWSDERLLAAEEARTRDRLRAARTPWLAFRLFTRDARPPVLLVVAYHAALDLGALPTLLEVLGGATVDLRAAQRAAVDLERRRLAGPEGAAAREYWRQALADLAPLRLQAPLMAAPDGSVEIALDEHTSQEIDRYLRAGKGSAPGVALAALAAALCPLADEAAIALVSANRPPALRNVLGALATPVVVQVPVWYRATTEEAVRGATARLINALPHAWFPFAEMVAELNPTREPGRPPFSDVILSVLDVAGPVGTLELAMGIPGPLVASGSLRVRALRLHPERSPFPFTVYFGRGAAGWMGRIIWRGDLVDAKEARAVAARFEIELRRILGHPVAERLPPVLRAGPLEILSTLRGLAAEAPDAVMIQDEARTLERAEVARSVARIAAGLVRRGVGPGDRVAVALRRSWALPVALAAILSCGASWMPLPSGRERRRHVLERYAPSLVLGDDTEAPDGVEPRRFQPLTALVHENDGPGAAPQVATAPAYTLFTSGSTGAPKGVEVSRGALAALLDAAIGKLPFRGRVLAHTSIEFDISILELLAPLLDGGCVVVAPEGTSLDPRALPEVLCEKRIDVFQATPTVLRLLVESGWRPAAALHVLSTGEALTRDMARELVGAASLWNLYGPTETTVWAAAHRVRAADLERADGMIPLGEPLAGYRLEVVDERLDQVLAGEGELLIGGAGVATAYAGMPGPTADRLRPDPAGPPGARRYRTGDRVRRTPDGELVWIGREDTQVKIRGVRVELDGVAAVLRTMPGVMDAVVVTVEQDGGTVLVAALRSAPGRASDEQLRASLAERLGTAAVPDRFLELDAIPTTTGGKLDRAAIRQGVAPLEWQSVVAGAWRAILGRAEVGLNVPFFAAGGNSLRLAELRTRLEAARGEEIPLTALLAHSTIQAQAAWLSGIGHGQPAAPAPMPPAVAWSSPIAVIGLSCRVAGAEDAEELWSFLTGGVEALRTLSDDELELAGIPGEVRSRPGYVAAGGFLRDPGSFDAALFGISPAEADQLDPQHGLLLEGAWRALEEAGLLTQPAERAGVFVGAGFHALPQGMLGEAEQIGPTGHALGVAMARDRDFLASRIAYRLGLRGPAVTVQTACSTGLVAVHLACQALRAGECDVAIAGAAALRARPLTGYQHDPGFIFSPDGHCRSFDLDASGTVPSAGAAVIVLRRLDDALGRKNPLRAVIRASVVANDGAERAGFTAPSLTGQVETLRRALGAADLSPEEIRFVEAHGSGTPLGDATELAALREVFAGAPPAHVTVGGAKANIGHADAAAGLVGLVKAVLVVERGWIPPQPNLQRPRPELLDGPLAPAQIGCAWPASGPRRAGVSSFGLGGTNAHIIIESAPERTPQRSAGGPYLLQVSARSEASLRRYRDALASALERRPAPLDAIASTLARERQSFPWRFAALAEHLEGATCLLRSAGGGRRVVDEPRVVFLAPGLGEIPDGVLAGLVSRRVEVRVCLERCLSRLDPALAREVRRALLDAPTSRPSSLIHLVRGRRRKGVPLAVGHACAFIVGACAAELWRALGVEPAAAGGFSVGEYTAAWIAGLWTLEEALALVVDRARLLEETPPGAMVAVDAPREEVENLLVDEAWIAAELGPRTTIVAASERAMPVALQQITRAGVCTRSISADRAFHTPLVEAATEQIAARIAETPRRGLRLPLLSNRTGTWHSPESAADPLAWALHASESVRMREGMGALWEAATCVLELGPGPALAASAAQHPAAHGPSLATLPSDARGLDPWAAVLEAAGELWSHGVSVELHQLQPDTSRVWLPGTPFERTGSASPAPARAPEGEPSARAWVRSFTPIGVADRPSLAGQLWWVLGSGEVLEAAVSVLRARGARVARVEAGARLERRSESCWTARPGNAEDLAELLKEDGDKLAGLLCAWPALSVAPASGAETLWAMSRALGHLPVELWIVASGLHDVAGEAPGPSPHAGLEAWCQVVAQESACRVRVVDVLPMGPEGLGRIAGLVGGEAPALSLWRGPTRYLVPRWLEAPLPVSCAQLRRGASYLVTGGGGRIGRVLATYIADQGATPVLLGRTAPVWPDSPAGAISVAADIADRESLDASLRPVAARAGPIRGVFHAAGLTDRLLAVTDVRSADARAFARARVDGFQVLTELLRVEHLDFVVAFSSTASVLGGRGLGPYAAACAQLDAAVSALAETGARALSIGWDGWRVTTEAYAQMPSLLPNSLSVHDALTMLGRILASDLSGHVVVSRTPLSTRLLTPPRAPVKLQPQESGGETSLTDAQRSMVAVWREVLGHANLFPESRFFSVGGDSLLGARLVARVNEAFGVTITVHDLWRHATVRELALLVENMIIDQIVQEGSDATR